jgi:hypothetical protein
MSVQDAKFGIVVGDPTVIRALGLATLQKGCPDHGWFHMEKLAERLGRVTEACTVPDRANLLVPMEISCRISKVI